MFKEREGVTTEDALRKACEDNGLIYQPQNKKVKLTKKESSGYALIKMNDEWCNLYCENQPVEHCNNCAIYEAIQRLGELEYEIERLKTI